MDQLIHTHLKPFAKPLPTMVQEALDLTVTLEPLMKNLQLFLSLLQKVCEISILNFPDALCLEVVADAGANFVTLTFMPPPDNRALYADQLGFIKLIKQRTNSPEFDILGDYLFIPGVTETGEGGILGIAIHPNWRNNGRFFVVRVSNISS